MNEEVVQERYEKSFGSHQRQWNVGNDSQKKP